MCITFHLTQSPLAGLFFFTQLILSSDREKWDCGCGSRLTCSATKEGILKKVTLSITRAVPRSAAQMENIAAAPAPGRP